MKVNIRKIMNKEEEQIIIECTQVTPEIEEIYAYLSVKGKELSGMAEGKIIRFSLKDVLYFEAVDEKVFAYMSEKVYEIKGRLYEVEEAYEKYHFIRCSKSFVINLMQLDSISPAFNGRFHAHMKNGEQIMISRQYISDIKKKVIKTEVRV